MLQTILVPIDGSSLSERALPFAEAYARATGARLVLVRVVSADQSRDDEAVGDAESPRTAEAYLAKLAKHVPPPIRCETEVLVGDAAPTILAEAARTEAGLIVMSTHGRSGIGRWIFGSVADAVMRQTTIPVLLIPANCRVPWPPDGPHCMLVPLDGSTLSEAALGPAGDLAEATHAELCLLRVVEPHPMSYAEPNAFVWIDPEPEREAARKYLSATAETLRARGRTVRTKDAFGFPTWLTDEVAREEKVDVIALSTHGRGGLTRLVMGSVATAIVQTAGIPILIVRPVDAAAVSSDDEDVAAEAHPLPWPTDHRLQDLAVRAAHEDGSAADDLLAALTGPELVLSAEVEPAFNEIIDPVVWQCLIELLAERRWRGKRVGAATADSTEAAILRRRLTELLLPTHVDVVENAKRQALLASIKDADPAVQVVALDLLGRREDPGIVEDVAAVLASEDLEVQEQAAVTLGRLGDPAAIEPLLRALRDKHSVVAGIITGALIRLGSAAVPALVAALADPVDAVRWHAAEALAALADPRAVSVQVRALEDPDPAVRWQAARGLARQGVPALAALLQALETRPLTPWLSQGARYVLHHLPHGKQTRELLAVAEALTHSTSSVEVPVRAEEALAAISAPAKV